MPLTFKLFLVPGSVQFLALGMAAGIGLLYLPGRASRWGRAWLTALALFYLFISTPAGSDLLAAPLARQYGSIRSASDLRGIDTVVVVTTGSSVYKADGFEVDEMGKSSAHNAMEAARVARLLGRPTMIVSGGMPTEGQQRDAEAEVVAGGLERLGIPRERMVLETRSRNTREQAENSARILRERRTKRFVLVTQSEHMPRAIWAFRAQGLDPVASVAIMKNTQPPGRLYLFRPTLRAYQQSDRACYEYFARLYYWVRDRLGLKEG